MDPLYNLFVRRNSFTTPKRYLQDFPLVGYVADTQVSDLNVKVENLSDKLTIAPSTEINPSILNEVNQRKWIYSDPYYNRARLDTNPFLTATVPWFKSYTGLELASIDATTSFIGSSFPNAGSSNGASSTSITEGSINAYNGDYATKGIYTIDGGFKEINKNYAGNLTQVISGELSFVCFNDEDGGYAEYLQTRLPESTGFVVCHDIDDIKDGTLDLNRIGLVLTSNRAVPSIVSEVTYKILDIDPIPEVYKHVKRSFVDGVNIVTLNCTTKDTYSNTRHESIFNGNISNISLQEVILALQLLHRDGSLILICNDTHTHLDADIIYTLSLLFNNVTMFKSIGFRMDNSKRCIIFRTLQKDSSSVIDILQSVIKDSVNEDTNESDSTGTFKPSDFIIGDVSSFLETRSESFNDFFVGANNEIAQFRLPFMDDIINQIDILKHNDKYQKDWIQSSDFTRPTTKLGNLNLSPNFDIQDLGSGITNLNLSWADIQEQEDNFKIKPNYVSERMKSLDTSNFASIVQLQTRSY
ncbi:hypothetical protein D3C87_862770 [compost metagenome]